MTDIRISAAAVVSATVLIGTAYSTHYWASKSNFLNVYFIKYAWGWTSAAFLALWATSPPSSRTASRLAKWTAETCAWLVFTSWFFGPALIERFIVASGGDCFVSLPSGEVITVPQEYCFQKTPINPVDHASLLASSQASFSVPPEWRGKPRLRKGHDISGHIFLLTMASLFSSTSFSEPWSALHTYAVWANVALVGLWLLASCTTSIYFHSPFEKITGLLLGIASFSITQIPSYLNSREKSHTQ
ncbi:hypothetical protein BDZ89DRAFT_1068769 [Hymenopellis radicata]|nr:hypothetical protein BDZ89DRAFT_1068769 [Hymenopellis radicata]